MIGQPNDKGILLKDIIEDGECLKDKSQTILATLYKENAKSMIKRNKQGLLILKNIYPKKGQNGNIYSIFGKCKTLSAGVGIKGNGIGSSNAPKIESINADGWRKLSPLECERLQTVPDNYTSVVSDTQRYKMLGNGWTVDVIAFILSHLNAGNTCG